MLTPLCIATVDDDKSFLNLFKEKIDKTLTEIGVEGRTMSFSGPKEILGYTGELHIVFLDIEMRKDSGINLAKVLKERYSSSLIVIFVTNHDSYAKQSIKAQPHNYLNKAEVDTELYEALFSAIHTISERGFIYIQSKKKLIRKTDILYITAQGNTSTVLYTDGEKETFRLTLKWWDDNAGVCFVKCHNSYMVNLEHVVSLPDYDSKVLVMDSGEQLKVASRRRKSVVDAVHSYMRTFGEFS